MLADKTEYLSAGIHIGMKSCTKYMKTFVYKTREDGLSVFNLQEVDNRIKLAAIFLSRYKRVLAVSHKAVADQATRKFAELINGKAMAGRFAPGTLTNPSYKDFYEPEIVIVADPLIDVQAVLEAKKRGVPVIGLCDTFNEVSDIDLVIPANNNGKKSMALVYWLLAREVLKIRGELKKDTDFKFTLRDFGDDEIQTKQQQQKQAIHDAAGSAIDEAMKKKPAVKKPKKKAEGKDDAEKKEGKTEDDGKITVADLQVDNQ